MKNVDVVKAFIKGGIKAQTQNLRMEGQKLISYNTTIAEFTKYGLIVNVTKYSVSTSKIQNAMIRELNDAGITYKELNGVKMNQYSLLSEYEIKNTQVS